MSWDEAAANFDDEPDHGLRDPAVKAAWVALLAPMVPSPHARIADLGCGTGSVSALFAQAGHDVHGVDQSPRMLEIARTKCADTIDSVRLRAGDAAAGSVTLLLGDAADPPLEPCSYDLVFARHVLWTLPPAAVRKWVALLRPGGRLLLVEGRWSTGAGLTADQCRRLVLSHRRHVDVRMLTDPALWGGPIDDERYLLVSDA
ncbi:class I SAM-dependent methyltransferase [Kutzneria chonburiensis]|uniref:Class I SAM-dependent methyltransferase n=1 Tax=Kutzneria chonburiensis TaxID=1483604 RepID=A0ABV6N134_9PSEU|nr:class I SAM-dependent methyltransferase [Kutzneria chonburiensis]